MLGRIIRLKWWLRLIKREAEDDRILGWDISTNIYYEFFTTRIKNCLKNDIDLLAIDHSLIHNWNS